ncbi:MAG: polysaccharide biosynthesis protein [Phycisphaerales bacterium]|nr:polysaccharide biosynthesis protein [Phycisphaerales bacterium]
MTASLSKRILTQGSLYGVVPLVNQGAAFLMLPIYSRFLGKEGFGIISLMGAVGTCLGFILIQGLHGAWFRLRFDEQDDTGLRRFEATIIWYLIGSLIVGVGILLLTGEWLAKYITPDVAFYPYGFLTTIYAAATVFVTLAERRFQAEQRASAFAVFGGVRTVLSISLIVLFVAVFKWDAEGKLRADAICAVVMGATALVMIRPGSPALIDRDRLRRVLAYGWALIPHNLAGFANDAIDRLIVSAMLGLEANGVYSMGYKIGAAGLIFATAMNKSYSTLFVTSLKEVETLKSEGNDAGVKERIEAMAQAVLIMVTLIACMVLGITAVARETLMYIAPEFNESWRVVAVIAVATLAWSCYFPFTQSLVYDSRRVRLLAVITVTSAIVNVIGNFLLIRWIGMLGAAWATVISSVVMAAMALRFGQDTTWLPYRWERWWRMFAGCALGLAILWCLDDYLANLPVRLAVKLIVAGLIALYCARSAGVRWADVRRLRMAKEKA